MTALVSWTLGQSVIDRAGGELRLRLLAKRLVERRFTIEAAEADGWIGVRLRVKSAKRGHGKLAAFDEWLTIAAVARSSAIRDDQRDVAAGDALVLDELMRAEVYRLSQEAGMSELELRYLHGDR